MKKLLPLLFIANIAIAQEKKPEAYSFGLGYGIDFSSGMWSSPNNSVNLSVWMPKNFEILFPLSFNYNRSENSQFDSVFTWTNSGVRNIERERGNIGSLFNFLISPGFVYHIPIKSNLDLFTGIQIPLGVNIGGTSTNFVTIEGENYLSSNKEITKGRTTLSLSTNLLLGCNYFFYKNLSIGTRFGLSVPIPTSPKRYKTSVTTVIENSGSDNPSNYNETTTVETMTRYVSRSIGFSLGGHAGLSLNYYFGLPSKKAKVE